MHINVPKTEDVELMKRELSAMFAELGLEWQDRAKLPCLLLELEEGERGETDVVQVSINTSDHPPKSKLCDMYHSQSGKKCLSSCGECNKKGCSSHQICAQPHGACEREGQ